MSVLWGIVIFVAGVGAGMIGCELMNAPVYDDDEDDWTWRWAPEDDETIGEQEDDQGADPEEE